MQLLEPLENAEREVDLNACRVGDLLVDIVGQSITRRQLVDFEAPARERRFCGGDAVGRAPRTGEAGGAAVTFFYGTTARPMKVPQFASTVRVPPGMYSTPNQMEPSESATAAE
jgi:hypothetical protein